MRAAGTGVGVGGNVGEGLGVIVTVGVGLAVRVGVDPIIGRLLRKLQPSPRTLIRTNKIEARIMLFMVKTIT
jgi:hypothetical protein